MDTPTPLDTLAAALADVDRAVEALLRLAWEPAGALPPEERRRAAGRLVSAYEQADRRADLLLTAIVGAGGCPGLLAAVEAAARRAGERGVGILALRAGGADERGAARALLIAQHAEERADARDLRVRTELVIPWLERLAERRRGEAA